jgi:DNA-directed RNA polymerase specialized sigma24 family protein
MADERADHTLDATALVHEAYVRLVGGQHFEGWAHFLAAAAEAMRRVLVDHSRNRARLKRGGGTHRLCVGTKSRPVFPT